MNQEMVITLAQEATKTLLLVSAPMLGIALVVGLAITIFQALTQIQEMTLTFVPKIVAVFVTILLLSSWLLGKMTDFAREIIANIPFYLR